jgi:four helix bundle protein
MSENILRKDVFEKPPQILFDRVDESQGGSSKTDFSNKVRISLREMRESNYWLRIIKRTVKEINISELDYLIKESAELKKILGSIVQKSR